MLITPLHLTRYGLFDRFKVQVSLFDKLVSRVYTMFLFRIPNVYSLVVSIEAIDFQDVGHSSRW